MGLQRKLSGSPGVLLVCLIAGGLVGWLVPSLEGYATLLGQIYLGVVSMAALPLLVVATFFGLRQTLALPQPGSRMFMVVGLGVVMVLACAVAGTLFGALAAPGKGLDHGTKAYLGALVERAGGDAGNAELTLMDTATKPQADPQHFLSDIVPDNFFRALVDGKSLGILLCAIVFGLAFAALSKTQNNALTGVFEAIYRALEIIISRVNMFIPLLVFGMAAFFSANIDLKTLSAMGGFLACFVAMALILCAAAALVMQRQSGLRLGEVLSALRAPVLISLTSASTTASIPDAIDAMSNRLGFSRGIVELVIPISSVFLRTGAALYYSLVAVFVGNLYGREFAPDQLALICVGSILASFASAGNSGVASVGFSGVVLSMLQLPMEAALALFVAIDVICEGPRNLLTLLFAGALIALVSRGLPSERRAVNEVVATVPPLRFAFSRADLMMVGACSFVVAALIVVLGIGIGMKVGDNPAGSHFVSPVTEPAGSAKKQ